MFLLLLLFSSTNQITGPPREGVSTYGRCPNVCVCVYVCTLAVLAVANKRQCRNVRAVRSRGRGAYTEGAEFKRVPHLQNEGDTQAIHV